MPRNRRLVDLGENVIERLRDVPRRVVRPHFRQVADIADMIADAILLDIVERGRATAESLHTLERFKDRAAVPAASADVVDLGDARARRKRFDEPRDVERVNVVAHLLSLVPEY